MVSLITIRILWPCRSSAVVQDDGGHHHDHVVHDYNESDDINDYNSNDPDDHELGRPGGFSVFLPALSLFSHPPRHQHTPYSLLQSITLENSQLEYSTESAHVQDMGVFVHIFTLILEKPWVFRLHCTGHCIVGPSRHLTGNTSFLPALKQYLFFIRV